MNSAIIDPMARDLPVGSRWTRQGRVRTGAGIEIGGAYQRPAPQPGRDAVLVQSALLDTKTSHAQAETRTDVAHGLACAAIAAATLWVFVKAPAIAAWLCEVAA
jgi:hypothetical protein